MSALSAAIVAEGAVGGYCAGGDPATWYPALWTWLCRRYDVRSVLDVGCGEGHSARFLRGLGCDVRGVDGSSRAIDASVIADAVVRHDFRDGPFFADRPFDMVWSCEFVEHVAARFEQNVLRTLACATTLIALTHAFPGQPGHHHVNCRGNAYWIHRIEELGFRCAVDETRAARAVALRDCAEVNHFARSGLLFLRRPAAPRSRAGAWSARVVSARINWAFRLSADYRSHRRAYRALKRARGRSRDAALESRQGPPSPGG
jgi:SAM-dependent methyltransferase